MLPFLIPRPKTPAFPRFLREPDVDLLTFIRRVGSYWGRAVSDATVAFISDAPFVHVMPCTGIYIFRPGPAAQRYMRAWWDVDQPKFNHGARPEGMFKLVTGRPLGCTSFFHLQSTISSKPLWPVSQEVS